MSACNLCGTPIAPGSTFCFACGASFPTIPPAIIAARPAGTQRALIGPTPLWQAITGVFMVVIGILAVSTNSFFAPIAAIAIIFGLILLVLGLMGKPIMSQQVVYESSSPAPSYQTGSMKRCQQCGSLIPNFALACEKCGAPQ